MEKNERNINDKDAQEAYAISNDEILEWLKSLREAHTEGENINHKLCRYLGKFTYKIKGEKDEKNEDMFLISETVNGISNDIIYDRNGKYIANKKEKRTLKIARDIKINRKALEDFIYEQSKTENKESKEEKINKEKNENDEDNSKEDRNKPREEKKEPEKKEEKKNNKKEQEKQNKTNNKKDEKLKNIIKEVDVQNKPLIALNTIINEKTLFIRLQLSQKLSGKLPIGENIESFKDGYFTYVESEKITHQNETKRKTEIVPVIVSRDEKSAFELDENILQPQEEGSIAERMERENSRIQIDEDGKEVKNPKSAIDLADIARFKINDDANRNGADIEYLTFRENEAHKRNNVNDPGGTKYNTEIYYERGPKGNVNTIDKNLGYNLYSEELVPVPRDRIKSEQTKKIAKNETSREAINEHFEEIAQIFLEENKEISKEYKLEDITNRIKETFEKDKSLDEAEIKERVLKDIEYEEIAKEILKENPEISNEYEIKGIKEEIKKQQEKSKDLNKEELIKKVKRELEAPTIYSRGGINGRQNN